VSCNSSSLVPCIKNLNTVKPWILTELLNYLTQTPLTMAFLLGLIIQYTKLLFEYRQPIIFSNMLKLQNSWNKGHAEMLGFTVLFKQCIKVIKHWIYYLVFEFYLNITFRNTTSLYHTTSAIIINIPKGSLMLPCRPHLVLSSTGLNHRMSSENTRVLTYL